jgi:hypothetical protein
LVKAHLAAQIWSLKTNNTSYWTSVFGISYFFIMGAQTVLADPFAWWNNLLTAAAGLKKVIETYTNLNRFPLDRFFGAVPMGHL